MQTTKDIAAIISNVHHFKHLNADAIQELINAGQMVTAEADTTLFWEDEPNAGLYVLLEGQVHLKKIGPDGQISILSILDPPFIFNEVPVLDGGVNPVTAAASQPAMLWHIESNAFMRLLQKYPQISLSLMHTLASHNRTLLEEYEDMCFRSVRARAAKLLLDLSQNGEKIIQRKDYSIEEMAARISTAPEAFSRALGFFRNNRYLHTSRTTIKIENVVDLMHLAQLEHSTDCQVKP